jgi:hypothetical protein
MLYVIKLIPSQHCFGRSFNHQVLVLEIVSVTIFGCEVGLLKIVVLVTVSVVKCGFSSKINCSVTVSVFKSEELLKNCVVTHNFGLLESKQMTFWEKHPDPLSPSGLSGGSFVCVLLAWG